MNARTALVLGLGLVGAGCALLVIAFRNPPLTLCDPLLGVAGISFTLAQVAGLLGLAGVARASESRAPILMACVAWAAASGATLAAWTGAGHLDSVGTPEILQAGAAGLALALLSAGLAFRAREATIAGLILPALLAAIAGFAASSLARGVAADRMILTWARLDAAALALGAVDPAELPPGDDVQLGAVAAALPPEARDAVMARDAWGRSLRFARVEPASPAAALGWRVWSLGADGLADPGRSGPTRRFDGDLVVSSGGPVAWPERPCGEGLVHRPDPVDLRGESPRQ